MPGTLYVVATPIGNLEDVTFRALRILREVTLIAAEDTRRTARLLQHYSISTRTTSLHEHNERTKTAALLKRLQAGESIALVSDAGTPVVSDPGAHLVATAHAAGIKVEPIPGPSAALAALSASGISGGGFVFAGFPPVRSTARKKWLGALAPESRPVILYEAPHRVRATLTDMLETLGDRVVCVCRELTKVHESLVISPISAQLGLLTEERGEFTLIVSGNQPIITAACRPEPSTLASMFGQLTNIGGLSRREAIRALAERHNIPAREIFAILEHAKIGQ
jgi:16S rRNA (cytidine1402-2'-O)-methyltransferase